MEVQQLPEEANIKKYVKTFLDILVLAMLNGEPMYGYKIMATIHREFGVLLSPGSIYPLLHVLEDKGLIESRSHKGKIVYQVSSKGKQKFKNIFNTYSLAIQKMSNFVKARGNISS